MLRATSFGRYVDRNLHTLQPGSAQRSRSSVKFNQLFVHRELNTALRRRAVHFLCAVFICAVLFLFFPCYSSRSSNESDAVWFDVAVRLFILWRRHRGVNLSAEVCIDGLRDSFMKASTLH